MCLDHHRMSWQGWYIKKASHNYNAQPERNVFVSYGTAMLLNAAAKVNEVVLGLLTEKDLKDVLLCKKSELQSNLWHHLGESYSHETILYVSWVHICGCKCKEKLWKQRCQRVAMVVFRRQDWGEWPSKSWSLFVIVESSYYSGKRPYSCISHVTLKTK